MLDGPADSFPAGLPSQGGKGDWLRWLVSGTGWRSRRDHCRNRRSGNASSNAHPVGQGWCGAIHRVEEAAGSPPRIHTSELPAKAVDPVQLHVFPTGLYCRQFQPEKSLRASAGARAIRPGSCLAGFEKYAGRCRKFFGWRRKGQAASQHQPCREQNDCPCQ